MISLIDLSAIYWGAWHATANKDVSDAHGITVGHVRRIAAASEHVAICCDSPKSWRKEKHPTYKANRPEKDQQAVGELRRVIETLRKDGMLIWQFEGFEADDIIASAVSQTVGEVVIHTADKDLMQLVDKRVTVQSHITGKVFDEAAVFEKFGVYPSEMRDFLALVGDKVDAVEGVAGVGPKTAAMLLQAWGTIDNIQRAIADGIIEATPKVLESLKASGAILDIGRELISLRTDVPLKFDEIFEERKVEPLVEQAEVVDEEPTEPEPTVSKAMVIATPGAVDRLQPTNANGALNMAKVIFNSRMYSRFPSPEAIFSIIVRGSEMGIGALTALDSFHFVEGKPVPHAMLIIARAKAHPDCEYFQCVDSTPTTATWETKNRRNPKPTRHTYTLAQAESAGLVVPGKANNWTKRPDEMIRKTAGVQLCRIEYPDAALGLYALEEME